MGRHVAQATSLVAGGGQEVKQARAMRPAGEAPARYGHELTACLIDDSRSGEDGAWPRARRVIRGDEVRKGTGEQVVVGIDEFHEIARDIQHPLVLVDVLPAIAFVANDLHAVTRKTLRDLEGPVTAAILDHHQFEVLIVLIENAANRRLHEGFVVIGRDDDGDTRLHDFDCWIEGWVCAPAGSGTAMPIGLIGMTRRRTGGNNATTRSRAVG